VPGQRNTEEEKLIAHAEMLPGWDETEVQLFREDRQFLECAIQRELEDYEKTGDIRYLLLTLHQAAKAKGWTVLSKETGLSRPALYNALSGRSSPKVDTLAKILQVLGFRLYFKRIA
jgi:probable addiction module antidote protein